jgi:alkanesulfonate monooxygenase SsuD/methylene tetrahydromethanopterin reductase-like flavin-dependent oxidoreductase (luciferase family)
MTDPEARFGVVLPHFGADPRADHVLAAARLAEDLGFHSVWVRDRLVAGAPHGLLLEAGGTTFFEPLTTLSAVAAVTEDIALGTAVLLPNRHPLQVAQQLGTLLAFAPDRVLLGLGLGVGPLNFEALGFEFTDRLGLFEELVAVLRRQAPHEATSHHGQHFEYEGVRLDPTSPATIPIYYGGVSRAAVRRAFEHADGWIAGRLPLDTFRLRMELVERFRSETGRDLDIATMPITLVDDGSGRYEQLAAEAVATLAGSAEGASGWVKPASGRFETIDDLAGLLIVGRADRCAEQSSAIVREGVKHLIFDLRLVFDGIEEQLSMLAHEVIPHLE